MSYGYKTAVGDGGGAFVLKWALNRTFVQAKDFSSAGGDSSPESRLAPVQDAESGLWGYIDAAGNDRIPARYADANRFQNGYAPVRSAEGERLWGLVNAEGREVISPQFRALGLCSGAGIIAAARDSLTEWQFVRIDGTQAFEGTYWRVRRFSGEVEGVGEVACVQGSEGDAWRVIDTNGEELSRNAFHGMRPFSGGLAPAQDAKTRLWGLVDALGQWQGDHPGPLFMSIGDKVGEYWPAHGSPAYTYDLGSDEWKQYENSGKSDKMFGYGYIGDDAAWVNTSLKWADTLIRASEQ